MPSSLTATKIKDTYGQVLHVDGGVTSTPKIVYDGDGTASALKVSTTAVEVPVLGISGGTANGVAYLNGSKVLTTGSALTFDGSSLQNSNNIVSGRSGGADGSFVLRRASDGLTVGTLSANSSNSRLELATAYDPITFSNYLGEQMRLTGTGLGIGTSSPGAKLDVVTAGGFSVGRFGNGTTHIAIGVSSDNTSFIEVPQAQPIRFLTNGTDRMRIDSSGNLGLGVTPSVNTLSKGIDLVGGAGLFGYLNQTELTTNAYFDSAWKYKSNGFACVYETVLGQHIWKTATSGTAGNAISFTQAMALDASGNLLVGATSGNQRLVLKGGDTNTSIYLENGSTSVGYFGVAKGYNSSFSSTDILIGGYSNNTIFANSGTERMRIDSSGNVLIGTTTRGITNSTSFNLDISSAEIYVNHHTNWASGTPFLVFGYGGNPIGSITQNGTTAVAYNTSSDYRLKENVQPMQNALDVVAQLNPVTYNWKADGSDGQGFIAHELQAVVPDCVTGEKDAVDAEGKPVYQGVDTSFLVGILTKAIQEQQQLIEALTARVAQLEGN